MCMIDVSAREIRLGLDALFSPGMKIMGTRKEEHAVWRKRDLGDTVVILTAYRPRDVAETCHSRKRHRGADARQRKRGLSFTVPTSLGDVTRLA